MLSTLLVFLPEFLLSSIRGFFPKSPCVPHCHGVRLLLTLRSESLELLFLRIGRGRRSGEEINSPDLLPMGKENVIFLTQMQITGGWLARF